VEGCPNRDLCVRDGNAVETSAAPRVTVRVPGIQAQPHSMRSVCPLTLEVLGWGDHGDAVDDTPGDELHGEPERESGLACSRCCRCQEVAGLALKVEVEGFGLPRPELVGGAPRGTFRVGG